ncbi:hypothetical protein AAFF_G00147080 [Aldrovandia affinis]|uniref:Uncharacterized protein n=1 Tax=Aldrovandia affinis TaxID=143900 RepID=A0AAD7RQ00_9TELE|nr:hypothetical protein AAFF_G00147080 [Aldrovandia affinis]
MLPNESGLWGCPHPTRRERSTLDTTLPPDGSKYRPSLRKFERQAGSTASQLLKPSLSSDRQRVRLLPPAVCLSLIHVLKTSVGTGCHSPAALCQSPFGFRHRACHSCGRLKCALIDRSPWPLTYSPVEGRRTQVLPECFTRQSPRYTVPRH